MLQGVFLTATTALQYYTMLMRHAYHRHRSTEQHGGYTTETPWVLPALGMIIMLTFLLLLLRHITITPLLPCGELYMQPLLSRLIQSTTGRSLHPPTSKISDESIFSKLFCRDPLSKGHPITSVSTYAPPTHCGLPGEIRLYGRPGLGGMRSRLCNKSRLAWRGNDSTGRLAQGRKEPDRAKYLNPVFSSDYLTACKFHRNSEIGRCVVVAWDLNTTCTCPVWPLPSLYCCVYSSLNIQIRNFYTGIKLDRELSFAFAHNSHTCISY